MNTIKDKFCKGFYKFFSNTMIRYAVFLLLLVIAATALMMQFSSLGFLEALAITVGCSIGIPLVFGIGIFIIDFFQDMYDKGKKLTEAEKKEVNME